MLTKPLITDYDEEAMSVNKHQSRRPANLIISKPFLILRSNNKGSLLKQKKKRNSILKIDNSTQINKNLIVEQYNIYINNMKPNISQFIAFF